ncbi:hypothetical protein PROFUN_09568 [Planoprotostelium fungivorum]|uniref:Uncharacterized protein n=1 Tax=Planoprotostelium fungivorum TaxID=1890364 RepID=A0A2P6NGR8_9EUKA|nr:hypothetical protein PROFUN_09568 [Planoprotostelium fungivorum]
MFLCPTVTKTQDLPTSCPAPSGTTLIVITKIVSGSTNSTTRRGDGSTSVVKIQIASKLLFCDPELLTKSIRQCINFICGEKFVVLLKLTEVRLHIFIIRHVKPSAELAVHFPPNFVHRSIGVRDSIITTRFNPSNLTTQYLIHMCHQEKEEINTLCSSGDLPPSYPQFKARDYCPIVVSNPLPPVSSCDPHGTKVDPMDKELNDPMDWVDRIEMILLSPNSLLNEVELLTVSFYLLELGGTLQVGILLTLVRGLEVSMMVLIWKFRLLNLTIFFFLRFLTEAGIVLMGIFPSTSSPADIMHVTVLNHVWKAQVCNGVGAVSAIVLLFHSAQHHNIIIMQTGQKEHLTTTKFILGNTYGGLYSTDAPKGMGKLSLLMQIISIILAYLNLIIHIVRVVTISVCNRHQLLLFNLKIPSCNWTQGPPLYSKNTAFVCLRTYVQKGLHLFVQKVIVIVHPGIIMVNNLQ